MPPPTWKIEKVASPDVELLNVQQVNVTKGRRLVSDSYATGTATLEGRRPDLLPSLAIGDYIRCTLTNPNTSPPSTHVLRFRLSDFRITYGIISQMDTWTIHLEDVFGVLGRAKVSYEWLTGTSTETVISDVCRENGLGTPTPYLFAPWKTISYLNVTDAPAMEVVQNAINTEQGLLYADITTLSVYTRGWQSGTVFYNFSDAGGAATRYQQLQFMSLADNYADKVVAEINGANPVRSGSGPYGYEVNTYAVSTTASKDVADYVRGTLSVQSAGPIQMAVLLNDETSTRALSALGNNSGVNVTFRGNTYKAVVIGYTISSDVNTTRVIYNIASADFYNFLVLDNATFGRLDYNRLGF